MVFEEHSSKETGTHLWKVRLTLMGVVFLAEGRSKLVLPKKVLFHRNRMNIAKANHFIEFTFAGGLIQDVAYDVYKIRFESGTIQTIPNAILTSKYSHIIAFYLETSVNYCGPAINCNGLIITQLNLKVN